jgi:hypothetical protein
MLRVDGQAAIGVADGGQWWGDHVPAGGRGGYVRKVKAAVSRLSITSRVAAV